MGSGVPLMAHNDGVILPTWWIIRIADHGPAAGGRELIIWNSSTKIHDAESDGIYSAVGLGTLLLPSPDTGGSSKASHLYL